MIADDILVYEKPMIEKLPGANTDQYNKRVFSIAGSIQLFFRLAAE